MKFSIYSLLISCLSIIIGETSPFPDQAELDRIAEGDQLNITRSKDHNCLKLSKGGEIYRREDSWNNVLVWKGTFNQTIDVAIKIVDKIEKMQNELNIFRRLEATKDFDIEKHRIPRVYYHGPFLGKYFAIAMTLFEEDLEHYAEQFEREDKKFSESTVLLIFKQAVESLSYIHSKNVRHYDIKLRNIFIRGNDVFIGDFDKSELGGNLMSDYIRLKEWIFCMVGLHIKFGCSVSNAQIIKYFQNEIVREAFLSIVKTENINGKFGILPNYKQIIKISDDALRKIGRTSGTIVEWLKEDGSSSSGH